MLSFLIYAAVAVCFYIGLYKLIGFKTETQTDKWLWLIFMIMCPIVGPLIFLLKPQRQ
jgi:hypothetical protein